MFTHEVINSLTEEELSLLTFIVLANNPNLESLVGELNKNTLKSLKFGKLKDSIFKARQHLKTEDNIEGISLYNGICEKIGIEKI